MRRKLHERPVVRREYSQWSARSRAGRKRPMSRVTRILYAVCLVAAVLFALALFVDQAYYYAFSAVMIGLGATAVVLYWMDRLDAMLEDKRIATAVMVGIGVVVVLGLTAYPPLLYVGAIVGGVPAAALLLVSENATPVAWLGGAGLFAAAALFAWLFPSGVFGDAGAAVAVTNALLAAACLFGAAWLATLRRVAR